MKHDFSKISYEDLKLAESYILQLELLGFDIVSDEAKMAISEAILLNEEDMWIETEYEDDNN